ncbi:MAG: hypothetical protein ATN31_09010 [Candidatus Epulonipiscioides saccharophilum]|nr:MAG: hypothetical protein ATN31_09010 [Epulopiscium sp. AS2M-Bin001]
MSKKINNIVKALFFGATMLATGSLCYATTQSEHPRLIVKADEYQELENKATTAPWSYMAEKAKDRLPELKYPESINAKTYKDACNMLREIINVNTILFFSDPTNKDIYTKNILEAIEYFNKEKEVNLFKNIFVTFGAQWNQTIPPAALAITSLVSLDSIAPYITEAEFNQVTEIMNDVGQYFWDHREGHEISQVGVRGTWALFIDDKTKIEKTIDHYNKFVQQYINGDGTINPGAGYAVSRFGSFGNISKSILPYLTLQTETGPNLYEEDQLFAKGLHWLAGYSMTPMRLTWAIGDTNSVSTTVKDYFGENPTAYLGHLFSEETAEIIKWRMQGLPNAVDLLAYLMFEENEVEAKAPTSAIFEETGAFFYEDIRDPQSLAAFLWSSDGTDGHAHKETNSVNITAYGEYLTINSGYNGWAKGLDGYTWDYINNSAFSANTVLVDYEYENYKSPSKENDHVSKSGGGVVSGFTNTNLDYARTNSGEAIPNAKHERSLVRVPMGDGAFGYFIIFDDIATESVTDIASVIHRPLTDNGNVVVPNEHYTYTINRLSNHNVYLSYFLISEPDSVEITKGAAFSSGNNKVDLEVLIPKYKSDSDKNINLATLLVPSDILHWGPAFSKYEEKGLEVGKLRFASGTYDYIFNSIEEGPKEIDLETGEHITFDGESAVFRKKAEETKWVFVENTTEFANHDIHFTADKSLSIFVANSKGSYFATKDTLLTWDGFDVIKVDGKQVEKLPAGQHDIELIKNN